MSSSDVDIHGLPYHLSFSQLSSWIDRCQKAFELERIRRAPRLPAWWFIGGSAVHEVTEELDRRILEFSLNLTSFIKDDLLEVRDLFLAKFEELVRKEQQNSDVPKESWLAAGFRPKQDEQYWRENGPQMIQNWLSWRARTGWEIAEFGVHQPMVELKLSSAFNLTTFTGLDQVSSNREVVGAPDRVMVLPNGDLVIVDVKSGSTTPKTVLQQGLYACLLEAAFGVRPKYGTFVKVGVKAGGVHTPLAPLAKFTEEYFSKLFSGYRAQAETGMFLPSVSDMCDRCSVAASCYAAGGQQSHLYDPLDPNYEGNHQ